MAGTTPPAFIEPTFWRKDPQTVERLLREALRRVPEETPLRGQTEVLLVTTLMEQHRFPEARTLLDSVLRRSPGNLEARFFDATLSFHMEEPWPAPWIKLESRWDLEITGPLLNLPRDRWDGGNLNGLRILLATEGGLGDEIQFARFAPMLKAAGAGKVLVSTNFSLDPLLATIPGVDCCKAHFDPSEYDTWIPIISIPGPLRVTPDRLPRAAQYLFPKTDTGRIERIIGGAPGLRVGLCWRSRKDAKTLPLDLMREVLQVPGLRFFALGEKRFLDHEVAGFPIVNLGGVDIMDTVAAVQSMDLVVTVDTMTSHLAGGLGKPVVLMLHRLPSMWWGTKGELTPWYPTMRLVRQQSDGRWEPVIRRVAGILQAWASSGIGDFLSFWSHTQKQSAPGNGEKTP